MRCYRRVLDHGYVELLDTMGDEAEVARAARISYGNTEDRAWEADAKLISYLQRNGHTSPFEMVEIKWRVKCPIFVARQWLRHRTANVNEFSMRYAEPSKLSNEGDVEYYTPKFWREQSKSNKQGGEIELDGETAGWVNVSYLESMEYAISGYWDMRKQGVSLELARIVLPVSVYTEFVWKNDLHNTLHFLKLRTDEHAQWEIRQYANAMVGILKEKMPRLMKEVWGD